LKKKLNIGALVIVALSVSLPVNGPAQSQAPRYVSPDLVNAGDIAYPVNTTATGLVTLLLSLSNGGRMENVQVLRDVPPLTGAAQSGVQSWSFKPASSNGNPVASTIPVSVIFNPFNPGDTQISGMSVPADPTAAPTGNAQYKPPQITSASFAVYPPNTLAQGTVVLDVRIGKTGQVTKVRVVHGVPPLTSSAINAVKSWSYNPAATNGQPAASRMVVAFVFQRNLS
jgi:TonB family protein